MLRIDESRRTTRNITISLAGALTSVHVAEFKRVVRGVGRNRLKITLDLRDLQFVDREGIAALATAEDSGVRLSNVPAYVKRWMAQEFSTGHTV